MFKTFALKLQTYETVYSLKKVLGVGIPLKYKQTFTFL